MKITRLEFEVVVVTAYLLHRVMLFAEISLCNVKNIFHDLKNDVPDSDWPDSSHSITRNYTNVIKLSIQVYTGSCKYVYNLHVILFYYINLY